MSYISKDLEFFRKRRAGAKADKYKTPKIILVDVDGTVVKPKVKMYSMSEERLGKKAIAELEKNRIRPLRKKMIKREISFEKYLIELSKIDIELGEYYRDYKNFFFGLVKKNLINEPLVRALGDLKKSGVKVIFLTSNLKIYGDIISDNVLRLIGEKGKFDGSLGAEYKFNRSGKAVGVKSLISHENAVCEGVKFQTKISAINDYFKKNKIKAKDSEVAVVSDADTVLMKHFGLGGLVLYPLKELLSGGYNVVIEIAPPTLEDRGMADDRLVKKIKSMGGKVFFFHASLDSVLKRNKRRRGEFGQGNLSKKLTAQLYKYCEQYLKLEDYIVISTDKIGADKTTSLIMEKIR